MLISEQVIPIPSSTSVSKWFAAVHSSVIRKAIQECLQSTVLFNPLCYDNVAIAMYKISHCSSGHKTAAVNKLVGELPTAPCSRGCMKTPLVGRFQTSSCTTGALPSQREYRPEDVDSLHSWTTIFLKIFGTYYYNISRIHLKHTHFSCFHAKNWPPFPFPSSTTPNSLAFAVTFCSQEIYISGKLQH